MSCPALNDVNRPGTMLLPGANRCPSESWSTLPPGVLYEEREVPDSRCWYGKGYQRIMYSDNTILSSSPRCCFDDSIKYVCRSDMCVGSEKCNEVLKTYCTGDMIAREQDNCHVWARNNPVDAEKNLRSVCNGFYLETDSCIQFCMNNNCYPDVLRHCRSDNNMRSDYCQTVAKLDKTGAFDGIVSEYCAANLKDPFCSCDVRTLANIPDDGSASLKIFKTRPECYIDTCSNMGFKNVNQKNTQCPPLTICDQALNLDKAEYNVLKNVNMSCGGESGGGVGGGSVGGGSVGVPDVGDEAGWGWLVWVFAFVVLVVVGYYMAVGDECDYDCQVQQYQAQQYQDPRGFVPV